MNYNMKIDKKNLKSSIKGIDEQFYYFIIKDT